jgi:hypothetical protein
MSLILRKFKGCMYMQMSALAESCRRSKGIAAQ